MPLVRIYSNSGGGGGTTTPAGTNGDVQFNDSNSFGGESAFTYDKNTNTLDVDKVTVNDEAYGSGWNGSLEVPTKNAVYDKIQSLPQSDTMILSGGVTQGTVASLATNYAPLFGTTQGFTGNNANARTPIPFDGTLQRFYFITIGSQPATGSSVVTVRNNQVDSSISVTVAAGSTSAVLSDVANTLSVTSGDLIDIKVVNNASTASIQFRSFTCGFTKT